MGRNVTLQHAEIDSNFASTAAVNMVKEGDILSLPIFCDLFECKPRASSLRHCNSIDEAVI